MATAFTGIMNFVRGIDVLQLYFTASDVADAYYIFPDGGNSLVLPPGGIWTLNAVSLSAAGADTARALVYKNGNLAPIVISNALNTPTTVKQQFERQPFGFAGGSTLKFQQKA